MFFKRIIFIILIIFTILVSYSPAYAFFAMNKGYYNSAKGEGWFWYVVKPINKKTKKKSAKPASVNWEKINNFSATALKKQLHTYLLKAISSPNERNVYNWLMIKDIVARKASKFTIMNKVVMAKYPYLEYYTGDIGGSSSYKSIINFDVQHNNKILLFKKIRKNIGFVLFYSPDVPQSLQEEIQLKIVSRKYGFYAKNVNTLNHPNQAKRFGVSELPGIVMFYRHKDGKIEHHVLTMGLRTQAGIERRIVYIYYALIKHKISGKSSVSAASSAFKEEMLKSHE